MTTCSNCNARLVEWGYDGAYSGSCRLETSEDCPVELCSSCAAFYEADFDGDSEGWTDCSRFECKPCRAQKGAQ